MGRSAGHAHAMHMPCTCHAYAAHVGGGRAHDHEELLREARGRRRHLGLVHLPQVSRREEEVVQRAVGELLRHAHLAHQAAAGVRSERGGGRGDDDDEVLLALAAVTHEQPALRVEALHALDLGEGHGVAVVEVEALQHTRATHEGAA